MTLLASEQEIPGPLSRVLLHAIWQTAYCQPSMLQPRPGSVMSRMSVELCAGLCEIAGTSGAPGQHST